ncbi:hypothetical protein K488DRAFT_74226 [Vararia minispora EC-137]|uniref:Uncharacterized protein n=1 Tax=Vararia minispora EC-137 TaxID=1314806 RepID=A0ACB8Q8E5_9AGAM|nr:hypothetical protein K488DRAFT_74226 [Vararia minispora EC-137]
MAGSVSVAEVARRSACWWCGSALGGLRPRGGEDADGVSGDDRGSTKLSVPTRSLQALPPTASNSAFWRPTSSTPSKPNVFRNAYRVPALKRVPELRAALSGIAAAALRALRRDGSSGFPVIARLVIVSACVPMPCLAGCVSFSAGHTPAHAACMQICNCSSNHFALGPSRRPPISSLSLLPAFFVCRHPSAILSLQSRLRSAPWHLPPAGSACLLTSCSFKDMSDIDIGGSHALCVHAGSPPSRELDVFIDKVPIVPRVQSLHASDTPTIGSLESPPTLGTSEHAVRDGRAQLMFKIVSAGTAGGCEQKVLVDAVWVGELQRILRPGVPGGNESNCGSEQPIIRALTHKIGTSLLQRWQRTVGRTLKWGRRARLRPAQGERRVADATERRRRLWPCCYRSAVQRRSIGSSWSTFVFYGRKGWNTAPEPLRDATAAPGTHHRGPFPLRRPARRCHASPPFLAAFDWVHSGHFASPEKKANAILPPTSTALFSPAAVVLASRALGHDGEPAFSHEMRLPYAAFTHATVAAFLIPGQKETEYGVPSNDDTERTVDGDARA